MLKKYKLFGPGGLYLLIFKVWKQTKSKFEKNNQFRIKI